MKSMPSKYILLIHEESNEIERETEKEKETERERERDREGERGRKKEKEGKENKGRERKQIPGIPMKLMIICLALETAWVEA